MQKSVNFVAHKLWTLFSSSPRNLNICSQNWFRTVKSLFSVFELTAFCIGGSGNHCSKFVLFFNHWSSVLCRLTDYRVLLHKRAQQFPEYVLFFCCISFSQKWKTSSESSSSKCGSSVWTEQQRPEVSCIAAEMLFVWAQTIIIFGKGFRGQRVLFMRSTIHGYCELPGIENVWFSPFQHYSHRIFNCIPLKRFHFIIAFCIWVWVMCIHRQIEGTSACHMHSLSAFNKR